MLRSEDSQAHRARNDYIYLALMVLIGSTTATAAKVVVSELPVALVPIFRFGGAGLCLLPFVWRQGALGRMLRESPGRLLACGALCVPINQSFFLYASRLAPTTHVGLFYAACPLVVLILAVAMGQERLSGQRLLGILATVLGVVVVGVGHWWEGSSVGEDVLKGDILLVGAVVSWGGYLTVCKPLVARHGAIPALAGTFLLGSLLDLPIALASRTQWALLPAASRMAWGSLLYLVLVVTVCGLACQNQALRRFDASQVAAVGNAAPLLTVIWGVWLLGEPFRMSLAVGGVLTLGGVVWVSRAAR